MKRLKIAYSEKALEIFGAVPNREIIHTCETDYTDVAAVVITESDADVLKNEMIQAFKIPVLLIKDSVTKIMINFRNIMSKNSRFDMEMENL